jgi:5-methylcytosine-specific restriction enzyme subunit McrC
MTIPIQNIYFLLCYAWDTLAEEQVVKISADEFDAPIDLFARVLEGGVTHLLKRGMDRTYVTEEIDTSSLRGKLDVSTTVKRNLLHQAQAHCVIDSLSYDVVHNQIIKATLRRLVRFGGLERKRHDRLMGLYRKLHEISDIEVTAKCFDQVKLHRNNAFYGFLLQVCRLIHENLIADQESGETHFRDFLRNEKQMAAVFERFVRNFFRREQTALQVSSENIEWQEVEADEFDRQYLPKMRTDISLASSSRRIVIDTKYYRETLSGYYDKKSIHSGNMYQLFSYVKNLQIMEDEGRMVEGMLLYPTVGTSLDLKYRLQGHSIRIATVDLNSDWKTIHDRLLDLLVTV